MDQQIVPVHIGIIMDGNGRWAKKRGLPRSAGHTSGAKVIKSIARHCNKIGVKYLTVYAFSTENWKRPKKEVDGIIDLLRYYLREIDKYVKENIRIRFIGDLSAFDQDIRDKIALSEQSSREATGLVFSIAINYGGRDEILHAVKQITKRAQQTGQSFDDLSEYDFSNYLYTSGMPDVDLVIRTGGEDRLSNFLIWEAAYAEFYSDPTLWPDYNTERLEDAIQAYAKRNRRFGGI